MLRGRTNLKWWATCWVYMYIIGDKEEGGRECEWSYIAARQA